MNITVNKSGCIYHTTEMQESWPLNRIENIRKYLQMPEKIH